METYSYSSDTLGYGKYLCIAAAMLTNGGSIVSGPVDFSFLYRCDYLLLSQLISLFEIELTGPAANSHSIGLYVENEVGVSGNCSVRPLPVCYPPCALV